MDLTDDTHTHHDSSSMNLAEFFTTAVNSHRFSFTSPHAGTQLYLFHDDPFIAFPWFPSSSSEQTCHWCIECGKGPSVAVP